ncbi:MAG: hypothetical protein ACRDA5_07210 [Clostridium sp.]
MNKELSKQVSKLNWSVTEEEVDSIVNKLGKDSEEIKYGVRHYKVLMELVCNKIDEELKLDENEIKCKSIALGGVAFTTANIASSGGAVYYRIIVTNTRIYSYSFDYFFKLVGKFDYDISEIKEIKFAEAGQDGIVPYEGYEIEFKDGRYVILYSINKFSIKQLDNLKDVLVEHGAKYRRLRTKKTAMMYLATTIAAVIFIIVLIIRISLNQI